MNAPRPSRWRFEAGDSLRAVAALGVFVSHLGYSVLTAGLNQGSTVSLNGRFGDLGGALLNSAALALFIFFALSGYLIAAPFIRAIVSARPSPRVRDYLLNRTLRIVPAYWAILTVLVLVIGTGAGPLSRVALPGDESSSLSQVASLYGFAQFTTGSPAQVNLVPQAWTLDVEAVFYLAVPLLCVPLALLARRLRPRQRVGAVGCMILAGCGASLVLTTQHNIFQGQPGLFGPVSPAWYMWAFAPGLALALAEAAGVPELVRRSARARRWIPRLLLVLAAAAFAWYAIAFGDEPPGSARSVGALLSILGVALGAVGAPLVREWAGSGAYRPLVSRPLTWVGKRSYSLYLVHAAVVFQLGTVALDLTDSAYLAVLTLLVMALPLCLLLSHLSYELVERPFLRLRTKPYGLQAGPGSSQRPGWRARLGSKTAPTGGSR